jgi:hypothetical protein
MCRAPTVRHQIARRGALVYARAARLSMQRGGTASTHRLHRCPAVRRYDPARRQTVPVQHLLVASWPQRSHDLGSREWWTARLTRTRRLGGCSARQRARCRWGSTCSSKCSTGGELPARRSLPRTRQIGRIGGLCRCALLRQKHAAANQARTSRQAELPAAQRGPASGPAMARYSVAPVRLPRQRRHPQRGWQLWRGEVRFWPHGVLRQAATHARPGKEGYLPAAALGLCVPASARKRHT